MKPLFGKIVSNKMQKSVLVEVARIVKDPKYGKYYKKTKKFMAHDEENACNIGDLGIGDKAAHQQKHWAHRSNQSVFCRHKNFMLQQYFDSSKSETGTGAV
ncbi:unnamed protein product [Peronospora belbahrii]|uniref:Uncharacterized protein n=1 Tax=Peronospora belbahrii TaxID=622444 RepID=A0AAU9KIX6_9STRA|nr:unnamed protein product [Peronospora belbahrii]